MERIIIYAVLIVFLFALAVAILEYFVPLSAKFDMNVLCRSYLMKLEIQGSLSAQDISSLAGSLAGRGFSNISVSTAGGSAQGSTVTLTVDADYTFSRLVSVFSRSSSTQHMTFSKTATVRKVAN